MKPFYIILLILWFVLAYFLCQINLYDQPTAEKMSEVVTVEPESETENTDECVPVLMFKDNEFIEISRENFKFKYSHYNHNLISSEFEDVLIKVAQYLGNNPSRRMKIKGLFLKEEENSTDYENLGLARAYAVKTYFLKQGVNTSQLLTSAKLANPECYVEETLVKGVVVAFDK